MQQEQDSNTPQEELIQPEEQDLNDQQQKSIPATEEAAIVADTTRSINDQAIYQDPDPLLQSLEAGQKLNRADELTWQAQAQAQQDGNAKAAQEAQLTNGEEFLADEERGDGDGGRWDESAGEGRDGEVPSNDL